MKLVQQTFIFLNLSKFISIFAQNDDCSCVSVDNRVSDQWCVDDCLCDWCEGCNAGVCAGFCDWTCDTPGPTSKPGPTDEPKTTTTEQPQTPAPYTPLDPDTLNSEGWKLEKM